MSDDCHFRLIRFLINRRAASSRRVGCVAVSQWAKLQSCHFLQGGEGHFLLSVIRRIGLALFFKTLFKSFHTSGKSVTKSKMISTRLELRIREKYFSRSRTESPSADLTASVLGQFRANQETLGSEGASFCDDHDESTTPRRAGSMENQQKAPRE